MPAAATVSTRVIQKIIGAAAARGADPAALVQSAGLTAEVVADIDARVSHDTLQALWREAARRTDDESFGLRVAELSRRAPDNVYAYAVQSSPTVAEALDRMVRYVRLAHDAIDLQVESDGAITQVRLELVPPSTTLHHGVECSLGLIALLLRQHVPGFGLRAVRFRHPAPASLALHVDVFAAPITFRADADLVELDRAHLDRRLAQGDPELSRHLDRHLELLLERSGGPDEFVVQVRRAIGTDLRGGLPDLDTVATRLHVGARSLQRRLRDSGHSYQSILDQVRRDLAVRYLGDRRLAISEIAFLVGFAEVTNFYRAFKRWTGTTPTEQRRRAAPAAT